MGFRYVLAPDGRIDPADRGLAYGDGLFETMAVRRGKVQRLDLHLNRLRRGAARLELPLPESSELQLKLEGSASGINRGVLKVIVTRGTGPRGYAPPRQPEPTIVLAAAAQGGLPPKQIAVATLKQALSENESLAGIKHLCRLEQVLGQLELQACKADEGLMLSTSGCVIGGTSRNLFAVFGQRLVTPNLRLAGVRGVMRQAVLSQCRILGLEVDEAELGAPEIHRANELFMTNALVGIQSVVRLDSTEFAGRDVAAQLRTALGLDGDD
jgi:4-amino-4-deoxychorismate lyase